jgi:predicted choloylglycine hydrolase
MLASFKVISLAFIFLYIFSFACDKDSDPVSAIDQTPYGTVSQIDDYPLFKFDYTSDYKFDEFLQTGNIPFYTSINTKDYQYSCTCFTAFGEENRLLGRNYDWYTRSSYFIVFTNPPDAYSSVSTVDMYFFNYDNSQPPAAEVNLNTIRTLPYYPFDGLNEKGVAVGMNALSQSEAPYDPSRVTIGELQLIRLVLDYAASTEEAISLIQQYNIRMENPPIHYLIADTSGHSVVIEFVNGQMLIMENTNPWQVTTNFVINGLDNPASAPCWRYKNACDNLDQLNGILSEEDAFSLLQNVSVSSTRWSTVFNLVSGEIQICMGRQFEKSYHFSIR